MAEYAKDVLVTTEWLAEHLNDAFVVVAEVDEDPDLYEGGHIVGAVKLHSRDDLQDPLERDLVDREAFERLMGLLGISNASTVVLYGDKNNWFAAVRLLVPECPTGVRGRPRRAAGLRAGRRTAGRAHPDGRVDSVVAGGARRRHLPAAGGAVGALRV